MSVRQSAGISYHLIVFFASIAIGALLWILIQPMANEILTTAEAQTSSGAAATGQNYIQIAINYSHLVIIGLGLLQLLVAAVFSSQVRR